MIKICKGLLPKLLIVIGMVFFGWNTLAYYEGYRSSSQLEVSYQEFQKEMPVVATSSRVIEKKKLYHDIPRTGEIIGELSIPKLNKTFPVYQGTGKDILKKGAGHVEGSALPGELNNCVISGHRDTIFRGLKDIEKGDRLIVSTKAGTFLYKVKKIKIVDADDRTVLTPKPRATLTLTTCYPFYYVGNAPQRYIVTSELIPPKY
ncbi:MAG TPA: class D sortase [Bacillus sp. (in: firmicutes)]|uniref:class D sortase n=1 Tax=Bacillus litorisediminis TaxID=2922713 RepID=UPI001FAC922B|nr:class D sortase [Bacillus litorisediminis]HWO75280.1 class D sortase [Bacillus sp. (in: firmicutes)]